MTADSTSAQLAGFWCELLDLDSVKPADRLLELGGNSLVATMIANRIEFAWGFRPTMEALLTGTLDELTAWCAGQRAQ